MSYRRNSPHGVPTVLNAYEVENVADLSWPVAWYRVSSLTDPMSAVKRGVAKNTMWDLRKAFPGCCEGYGFIVEVEEGLVAVPAAWSLPDQADFHGHSVKRERASDAQASQPEYWQTVTGILSEAVKQQFKNEYSEDLGPLWQDFGVPCELPDFNRAADGVVYCRKYTVSPERLANDTLVLQVSISTVSVGARSFASYYEAGEVSLLAELIGLKRVNRLTRKGKQTNVRVLLVNPTGVQAASVYDLERPEDILEHIELDPAEQQLLTARPVFCKPYKRPAIPVDMSGAYLILDTHITQERHRDTIIPTHLRAEGYAGVRGLLQGLEAFGNEVKLADDLIAVPRDRVLSLSLPSLRINVEPGVEGVLPAPRAHTEQALQQRARRRSELVRDNGFLFTTQSINPVVTAHRKYGGTRAQRLTDDLNGLVTDKHLAFAFAGPILYDDPSDIAEAVERFGYNAVVVVLPEGRHAPRTDGDTHHNVKKKVGVTSQCLHHDTTLHPKHTRRDWVTIQRQDARHARNTLNNYEAVLQNLLTKHAWIPFMPADPFGYNVHVGIDVGGRNNNFVMACVGYGLAEETPYLVPGKIEVKPEQKEPIFAPDLYIGLLEIFERVRKTLMKIGQPPNFERVLILRDGEYRGQGEEWQELDALKRLHAHYLEEGAVSSNSVWTAVELSKRAGLWRQYRAEGASIKNPLVATSSMPFANPNEVLVATTGSPYVTQGTASPLLARIHEIYGDFDRATVIRDLVWEADMCFTKLDTGLSLPWVLHVADAGALQLSKAYKVTGVPV